KISMSHAKADVTQWPGMIVGVGVVGIRKDKNGNWDRRTRDPIYEAVVKLTVMGMSAESSDVGLQQGVSHNYWIVDDSRTGIWKYDERWVYVPLDVLQNDLQMAGDPANNEPARVTDIEIGLKSGYDMYAIKPKIQKIVESVLADHNIAFEMDK